MRRIKSSSEIIIAFILLFLILAYGCSRDENSSLPMDKISLRLKWRHQPQFAGFYAAAARGYYQEENLAVTLEPGGPEHNGVGLVAAGKNDFGVVAPPELIVRRSQGVPVKAIAVVYRESPLVYFSLDSSGIKKPTDFIGKKVMVYPRDFVLPALLNKMGIRMTQIQQIPPTFDLAPLFDGRVDIWSGYLINQVVSARSKGYRLNLIFPHDYGIHTYGDAIIARDDTIRDQPDLVRRFLKASLKGWRWAIQNPQEAALLTLSYNPELDEKRQVAEMEASVPLIHTGRDNIGWMKSDIWRDMHQMLLEQRIISQPVPLENVYSMQFLEAVYSD